MIDTLFEALALPASARMERRVPKALLADHGATGAGDRKLVEGGIERLRWRASLKPATIGVPAVTDDARDYSEIAVLTLEARDGAKNARLAKIAHAAIPYPLILLVGDGSHAALSLAPKRRHERQADRFVVERLVTAPPVTAPLDVVAEAFLASLTVAQAPAADLRSLYEGMMDRAEAYAVARVTGVFRLPADTDEAHRRHTALDTHTDRSLVLNRLRRQVKSETRLSNRLSLARMITIIEDELAQIITTIR